MRIQGKRLRYAMEVVAACFQPAFREELYPAVEEMQEILGAANDSHVAAGRLGSLREKIRVLLPAEWKRLKPGIEGLLSEHRDRLVEKRKEFLAWCDRWQPRLLVNIGTCGGFAARARVGDVVLASHTVVYDIVVRNGKTAHKSVVSTTPKTAPVEQVVEVGTKKRPATTGSGGGGGSVGGGADGLNWAALAQCESGGNPRAVTPAGYYGLYQFSLSTWHSVGGSCNPMNASSGEQTYRAKLLYKRGGAGQWGCGSHLFD